MYQNSNFLLCEILLQEDERQAIDYEKIPANHIFNNGLSLEYIKIVKVKIQQENGLHKFN